MALIHLNFFSDALHQMVDADVILPEKSKKQIGMESAAGESYPTLYLLHGMSDDHTIWQRRTSIERYVSAMNLAVVMPDGDLSWYTDMYRGDKYWTFISEELPQICRSMFPHMRKDREGTFAAGLSMGGYGALKLGLRAPEKYAFIGALSAACEITDERYLNERKDYWESLFGPFDQVKGSFNDLFAAAEELAASDRVKPDIYMWCGTEDRLFQSNEKMRDHLNKLGFNLTWEQSSGIHAWEYWDEKIKTVLSLLPIRKED